MDCTDIKLHLHEYISEKLNASETADLENHIQTCDNCRAEYYHLKDTINFIHDNTYNVMIPEVLAENLKKRVLDLENTLPEQELSIAERTLSHGSSNIFTRLRKRKAPVIALIIAAVFFISFSIILFTNNGIKDALNIGDGKLRNSTTIEELMSNGYGDKIDISCEYNNIRITLENIVADDYNTLISYKIEGLSNHAVYSIYPVTVKVEGGGKNIPASRNLYQGPYKTLDLPSDDPNAARGILRLDPIADKRAVLKVGINQLFVKGSGGLINGSWNFDIPVMKSASVTHTLNKELELDGNNIIINDITFAKTATILSYRYSTNQNPSYTVNGIFNISLSKGDKEYRISPYNGGNPIMDNVFADGTAAVSKEFDPVYADDAKDITINFKGILISVKSPSVFNIDMKKPFPQNFQYMGSEVTVDGVIMNNGNTQINISRPEEKRDIAILEIKCKIKDFSDYQITQYTGSTEGGGYIFDKNDSRETFENFYEAVRKMDEPRIFASKEYIEIQNNQTANSTPGVIETSKLIPEMLTIEGYMGTKYVNQSITVDLK